MNESAFKLVVNPKRVLAVVSLLGVLSILLALYAQHVDGHEPCSLCMLSRLLMIGLAASGLMGLVFSRFIYIQTASLWSATAFSVSGVYWSIFQLDPVSRMGCGMSKTALFLDSSGLSDALPWLLEIRAMCAGDLATWFGLSFPAWGGVVYTTCATALIICLAVKMFTCRVAR